MDKLTKSMLSVTLSLLVLLGLAGVIVWMVAPPDALARWSARAGVVAADVEDRIDALLGKEAVLRQQALDAIRIAEDDVARLETLAVTSRVDARLLEEKLVTLQTVETRAKTQLGQLAAMVEAGKAITLDGKTWQPDDLKAYAQSKITEYTAIQERRRVLEESQRIQLETAERAETAMRLARQNIANMRAALDLLDAKFAHLRLLQSQPTAMPGSSSAAATVLADAETLVQSLLTEVEREVRIADERSRLQTQQAPGLDAPLPTVADEELVNQLYTLSGVDRASKSVEEQPTAD
ncbi:MAG TPA: hypothetical protein DCL15_01695 [Chloroflexi bacterium]|nr:hypothetical protein [Chloroflexota bacterium]HHW84609.1 hypothetical protein [Chloroflexota bacterium]